MPNASSPARSCKACGRAMLCPIPGSVYARAGGRSFCTEQCRDGARWSRYINGYTATGTRKKAERAIATRRCLHCDTVYGAASGGGHKYCSTNCASSAKAKAELAADRARKGISTQPRARACACCGVVKAVDHFGNADAIHCKACGHRAPAARRAERARIAAKAGKAYHTAKGRRNVALTEVEKTERAEATGTKRCMRRLLRSMLSKVNARIRKRVARDARKTYVPQRTKDGRSTHPVTVKWCNRYHTDPEFRLKEQTRARVRKLKHLGRPMVDDGTVTATQLLAERECPYCSIELTDSNRVLDHMEPLAKGGHHTASNVIACCWTCNARKGSKPMADWLNLIDVSRANAMRVRLAQVFNFDMPGSLWPTGNPRVRRPESSRSPTFLNGASLRQ